MGHTKELFAELTAVCTVCGCRHDNPDDIQSIHIFDACRLCVMQAEYISDL